MINKMLIKQQEINSMKGKTFYERYLNGEYDNKCLNECIDDEIEVWHNSEFKYIELYEFLGLHEGEFDEIVANNNSLAFILWFKALNEEINNER